MAPVLTTQRLTLSGHGPDDLTACAALWADPQVYKHIGGTAHGREAVWQRILRYIGHWPTIGYGYWIAHETASGRMVGEMGLMDTRRATVPSFEGTPECGWALASWAHGQGFATEALNAVFAWADPRLPETACIIDPANAPSIRLAERMGYRLRTEGTYNDHPTLIFARRAAHG